MPTPPELTHLAQRLAAMTAGERMDLAKRAGVDPELAHRAAGTADRCNVKPFDGPAFIQLCAALGLDPLTGEQTNVSPEGPFVPEHFGCALRIARYSAKMTQRKAVKAWGVEKTAIHRAEHGIPISVAPLLGLFRAIDRHPFEFMRCTMFTVKRDSHQERVGVA